MYRRVLMFLQFLVRGRYAFSWYCCCCPCGHDCEVDAFVNAALQMSEVSVS
ncbi:hypothetical protein M758_10G023500 [Ceratodon purpureus]|uniref:Uncharacterized protein n=1 Tax=Ceratodon purpureus TaxID=3225 RepID=A0A8T0GG35_CERPU|nr:hypothetical protein KC19_10G025100 [Ceratodon purpureus]KAG0602564.1 hypothetical protein M758_10G023500 [Ceratodon purpureus]